MNYAFPPHVNNPPTVSVIGYSGHRYTLQAYPFRSRFIDRPGIYAFARLIHGTHWQPLYVGQSSSLENRLWTNASTHTAMIQAEKLGATHTCVAFTFGSDADRFAMETDIRRALIPPLNQQ